MAGNVNTKFPTHIAKFPDITPPAGYEVAGFPGFVPVEGFTHAGHHSSGQMIKRTDGMLPVQEPDPVGITLDQKMVARVNKIAGQGLLKDKKIECIELARSGDSKHTESFKQVLEGVSIERSGDMVVVLYQRYTDTSYGDDSSPPEEGGYDFLEQKKLG